MSPHPDIVVTDDVLDATGLQALEDFLRAGGWSHGWKSKSSEDTFAFMHRHFDDGPGAPDPTEVRVAEPIVNDFWRGLQKTLLSGHALSQCYANGMPYGSDGSVHTDDCAEGAFTSIFYPGPRWHPNWGGETVFVRQDESDIIGSVYPRRNRLVTFPGSMKHVARGVSRRCPVMRLTLMFKTRA